MEIFNCAHDSVVSLEDLKPNPENNNRHSIEQIKRLAKIIAFQGQRSPIVVSNRSGYIVKGHCRLEALKELGWTKAAVDYQDYADAVQEYADMTADNEIARWAELDKHVVYTKLEELGDLDIELLGIEDFEIPNVEVLDPEKEDDVPEVLHDPITRKGDVWLLGNHRVMCGDSTMIDDVEKLMKGEKADMVFTDPPYGGKVMGKAGGKETGFNKAINKIERDVEFISNFEPKELINTLEYINAPSSYVFTNLSILKKYLFENSKILVWDKKHGMPSVGNYNSDIEFIVFTKQKGALFNNGVDGLRYSRVIRMAKKENHLHPTMKPIDLITNCIEVSSKGAGVVVDLFLGSGSTLIACEKTNRKCYGMELDEHYCDVIITRWQQYTGKEAVLESTGETYKSIFERERQ